MAKRGRLGKDEGQFPCQLTEKGFKWGPVELERIATEPDNITGGVTLELRTEEVNLEIYVTPVGMVRIYLPEDEMIMVQAAGRLPGVER